MSHPVYIPIEKNFTQTQVEMKDFLKAKNSISIGIPKESFYHENRVGLVPHSVHNLVARGHQVLVESGAGENQIFRITIIQKQVLKFVIQEIKSLKPM